MLGGSGPALLRLAAEEADILNMIPPTGGKFGEVIIEDALKFDTAEFRRRTGIMREHARKVGRDPREIELLAVSLRHHGDGSGLDRRDACGDGADDGA